MANGERAWQLRGPQIPICHSLFAVRSTAGAVCLSRLDSFIRRMQAQRSLIAYVSDAIRDLEGPVLELGLGQGRTYDHLKVTFPKRRVIVLDRRVSRHAVAIPP